MPPLVRSRTFESLHSWWSDSNPVGATMSIHAAAKPLMKLMYHEQVRGFLKKNRGQRLSISMMDILASYLAFKYISNLTKTLVLKDILTRLELNREDALLVAGSLMVDSDLLTQMFKSPASGIRGLVRDILGKVAFAQWHEVAVLAVQPCVQLISLPSTDMDARNYAIYALSRIGEWPDGAQTISNAKVIEMGFLSPLLNSSDSVTRELVINMLGKLAQHQSTGPVVLRLKPCSWMMSFLSDRNMGVSRSTIYALSIISRPSDGAQAVVTSSDIVAHAAQMLHSHDTETRRWARAMFRNVSIYPTTAKALLLVEPFPRFVELLRTAKALRQALLLRLVRPHSTHRSIDMDTRTCNEAISALSKVSEWPDGADATEVIEIGVIFSLLGSSNTVTRERVLKMAEELVQRQSSGVALRALKPCEWIMSFLRGENIGIRRSAIQALATISQSVDGAEHVIASTDVVAHAVQLLHGLDTESRGWACKMLRNLSLYSRTPMALAVLEPCSRFVELLSGDNLNITKDALCTLAMMSRQPAGAHAAVGAGVLDHIFELLASDDWETRRWTCYLLGTLSTHEHSAIAALELGPWARLVADMRATAPAIFAVVNLPQVPVHFPVAT
ncbi:armadillo-type protein [Mycena filopes]|nr:armadillo-type protein [Mycena filopes]